ncbi:MAG: cyclase family protein [Actinomycetota bacterium]
MQLPSYDELPPAPRGGRSGWGLFGAGDNVGLMNLQTPARVAAAAAEVQRGAVFPLSAEVRLFDPPMYGRRLAVHRVLTAPDDPGLDDELDSFNPQSSSQWDSLGHVPYATDAFFNGATKDDVISRGRGTVDHWARRGIAGRGVLLDVEQVIGGAGRGYDPGAAIALTVDDLEQCRAAAGVDYQPGDVLLLYTGFGTWYLRQDAAGRAQAAQERTLTAAGVEHTEDMARYLWDSHVSAVVSDNPSVEVWPPDWSREARPFGFLHRMLIGQFGMALGELWWLSDLAQDCREDGRHTMFICSAPLHVAGGISSPPNALAIK